MPIWVGKGVHRRVEAITAEPAEHLLRTMRKEQHAESETEHCQNPSLDVWNRFFFIVCFLLMLIDQLSGRKDSLRE
jgi:hypothetical protein